jgi:hypothetical protein
MIKLLITFALAFVAGYIVNEHTGSDHVTRAMHSIEDTATTIRTDHVALEGHLARRERRDQMMFTLFDRIVTLIEKDVAHQQQLADN